MLNEIDLSRADLNLLVLFEAVLAEAHVGRAAARLSLSPSAVSHGLKRLRRLLGDPLFVRTPKGVVPTARAAELAQPIADVLARARSVLGTAAPFDPARSGRRFLVGAPDAVSAVIVPPLLAELRGAAPGVDIGIRQLLPTPGETAPDRAWRGALGALDEGAMAAAILPLEEIPARFHARLLYEEDFVIAVRLGHPFAADPSLSRYVGLEHLVVSLSGDPHGFVDRTLAARGLARRIALTLPNFMFALAVVGASDLASALPRRFVAMHAARFGVVALEPPIALDRFRVSAVAPKPAMLDLGIAWLFESLQQACRPAAEAPQPRLRRL